MTMLDKMNKISSNAAATELANSLLKSAQGAFKDIVDFVYSIYFENN